MKKLFFFLLLLDVVYPQTWHSILPWPSKESINGAALVGGVIWTVGDNGTILTSADGGRNWQSTQGINGIYEDLTDIQRVGSKSLYITGTNGYVFNSTDEGRNWSYKRFNEHLDLNCVTFLDSLTGWCAADSGIIYHTFDGGKHWGKINTGVGNIRKLQFLDEDIGICGETIFYSPKYMRLHKTTDGGNTWASLGNSNSYLDFYFVDEQKGFGLSSNYLYYSENGGNSWLYKDLSTPYNPRANTLFFKSNTEAYIAADDLFFRTTDSWNTWYPLTVDRGEDVRTFINNEDTLYAFGEHSLILKSNPSGIKWQMLSRYFDYDYLSFALQNDSTYWMLGRNHEYNDGKLYFVKSTNKGRSWTLSFGSLGNFNKIIFYNENKGLLLGSRLIVSSSGGNAWDYKLNNVFLYDADFVDTLNLWVTGLNGDIYRSSDGGDNWIKVNLNTTAGFLAIDFPSASTAYLSGVQGILYKTTNGGNDWLQLSPIVNHDVYDLLFIDENTGFAASNRLYKTVDGGQSWHPKTEFLDVIKEITYIPPSGLYACSVTGNIYSSSDLGESWSITNTDIRFTSISAVNQEKIFITGEDGILLSTVPYNSVDVKQTLTSPGNYTLSQNYPNPFNPSTKIKFSVPAASPVSLKVYDILGREIVVLINKELLPGSYEVDFNGAGLSSGVYFYRLEAGGFASTQKMILLR